MLMTSEHWFSSRREEKLGPPSRKAPHVRGGDGEEGGCSGEAG